MEETAKQMQEVREWAVPQAPDHGGDFVKAPIIRIIGFPGIAVRLSSAVRRTPGKYERVDGTSGSFFASLARYAVVIITLTRDPEFNSGVQTTGTSLSPAARAWATGLSL